MNGFSIHPLVYSSGQYKGLLGMLEDIWVRNVSLGKGTMYIASGFANYNGGVRFYDVFRNHIKKGGDVLAYFGASTSQKLSSKQVVEELLGCGVKVNLINRKRIFHMKCYGYANTADQRLVVSSGNFTGPGMSQNVEASLLLDSPDLAKMGFSWSDLASGIDRQR
ncbi:MAG TPA: phospholipase D-like domain-containing protein, partial [Candidatus Dojkabacteria bacterium]|nr:phospholipase D-like domain-containing protein [Candidatus Dojkabacteria bacterium]